MYLKTSAWEISTIGTLWYLPWAVTFQQTKTITTRETPRIWTTQATMVRYQLKVREEQTCHFYNSQKRPITTGWSSIQLWKPATNNLTPMLRQGFWKRPKAWKVHTSITWYLPSLRKTEKTKHRHPYKRSLHAGTPWSAQALWRYLGRSKSQDLFLALLFAWWVLQFPTELAF